MSEYTNPDRVTRVLVTPDNHLRIPRSGYGGRIPTHYMVDYVGTDGTTRRHRVYVMQYANSGSAYIIVRGSIMFLDTYTEYRVKEYAE